MRPDRFPTGLPFKPERNLFLAGSGAALLYSLICFLPDYLSARKTLYQFRSGEPVLLPGAVMPPFSQLMDRTLLGFLVLALCSLTAALLHYGYFYRGSKSIYLMRRLPDSRLLHRQCWTMPLAGAALCVVMALSAALLFLLIYLFATPAACLPMPFRRIVP